MNVPSAKRHADAVAVRRRRILTVVGSGKTGDPQCAEVGRLAAALGFDLLTGGGRGVMADVSQAFFEASPRHGLIIGIVPATVEPLDVLERQEPQTVDYVLPPGYPNKWVEIAIYTHLPDSGAEGTLRSSRNHINVLSADVIVAFPGQGGTLSEIWLATQYGVPVVAYGSHHGGPPFAIPYATSLDALREFLSPYAG
jgi:predicted Rossmann-fold nucleotide-binding protein